MYDLTLDDAREPAQVLSVNPSPKESQLVYDTDPHVIDLWRLTHPGDTAKPPPVVSPQPVRLAGILQQRLWWWMLLGGLLALLLETALAEGKKPRA